MADMNVSVAEVKAHLSEYIDKSTHQNQRIIITKRNKPVAALVNINDLRRIETSGQQEGLSSIIGLWNDFKEIEGSIRKVYNNRNSDNYRNVSL